MPTKKRAGRPRLIWTDSEYEQVEKMAEIHCTQDEICGVMRVDHKTLTRLIITKYNCDFSQFINKFGAMGKMSLRRAQFKKAIKDGNTAMLIWLGKQYLGQRDEAIDTGDASNVIEFAYTSRKDRNGTDQ